MLSDPGDAARRCPLSPRAMLPSDRMKPSAIPKKYFNGAQSLQPQAYGLHPLCLRLAIPVTSKSPRLDTECGGAPLLRRDLLYRFVEVVSSGIDCGFLLPQ